MPRVRRFPILNTSDVAYVFGAPPPQPERGQKLLPGQCLTGRRDPERSRLHGALRNGSGAEGSRLHPTPRFLPHLEYLVRHFAAGRVLDPFSGSGTSIIAARLLGWPAVGVEIEERYCEIAARRLSQGVLAFDGEDLA